MVTPEGLYTGNRVIMGLKDAVTFAQRVAERVFKAVLNQGVQVCLIAILGYAERQTKFLENLETVLKDVKYLV